MTDASLAEPGLVRSGPLAGHRSAAMSTLAPALRFSLRGTPAAVARIGAVFGVVPGEEACRAVTAGVHAALWLGPDEWLLIAPDGDAAALGASLEAALADEPHSLVDVSHRNTGLVVDGPGAADLLNEGCPLDLSLDASPVGLCTRTVLGKAEIVLWRVAADRFRIECWRSYAPYLRLFLAQAAENQD